VVRMLVGTAEAQALSLLVFPRRLRLAMVVLCG